MKENALRVYAVCVLVCVAGSESLPVVVHTTDLDSPITSFLLRTTYESGAVMTLSSNEPSAFSTPFG